jgi:hypothetical protein
VITVVAKELEPSSKDQSYSSWGSLFMDSAQDQPLKNLVHEELIDGKEVAWMMFNELWKVPHAIATAQAGESEAFKRAFPEAGEGRMLSNGNEFRCVHQQWISSATTWSQDGGENHSFQGVMRFWGVIRLRCLKMKELKKRILLWRRTKKTKTKKNI